ncbi:thymidylate kinase, partial [Pleurotus eryngii]
KRRGAFIVVEGLDRSGKTTQCAALHERLVESGVVAELIKFPDRTTVIGQMIDSYLKSQSDMDDHLIHLLFSANRWELASSIERQLREGTSIVCDRYAFSGIAFSASKGLSYAWCRSPDIDLPAPDVTIFLDVSPEKAKERGGYGEERYEKEEMQKKVRQVFRRIEAEMQGQRLQSGGQWVTIDAGRDRETVSADVWRHAQPLITGVEHPIRRLWTDILRGKT